MRFEVKNLKELKEAVYSMDDNDRLSLHISIGTPSDPSLTKIKYAFRVMEEGIFIHEIWNKW